MRKKIYAIILSFILTLWCASFPFLAFAETVIIPQTGEKKISSWSFSDSFDADKNTQLDKASNSGGALIAMNGGDWISFSVNAEKEGYYGVTMAIANTEGVETPQGFNLSVNGEAYRRFSIVAGKGWAVPVETNVGIIPLKQGENTITFTSTTASMYFFYFKLERYTGADLGDVTLVENQGIYGASGYLTFSENSLSYFDLPQIETGFYKLGFTAKADKESTLNISVSGITKGMVNIKGNAFYEAGFYLDLKETDTQLKIAGIKGNVDFSKIKLYKLGDTAKAELVSFASALNDGKSEQEIEQAAETAKDVLHPDGIYPEDALFSMTPVWRALKNSGYKTIQEAADLYFKAVGEELNNPSLKLLIGNEEVKEIKSGNIKVLVDANRLSIKEVFGAIYEGDRLFAVACGIEADESLQISFGDITLNEEKSYTVKVFFLDSLEGISPTDTSVFKEIYVDSLGNDITGDGSENAPFKTIKRAKEEVAEINDAMTGDIIVNIASGEYYLSETEVFDASCGGKNGFDVIYRGTGDKKPEIVGGEKVGPWTPHENGIYKAPLIYGTELRNLYVNGYSAVRAHEEFLYEPREYYDDPNISGDKNGFVIYPYQFPESIKYPSDLELVWKTWWVSHRTPVDNIIYNEDEVVFVIDSKFFSDVQSTLSIGTGKSFYAENALEFLDEPGEFYYSKADSMLYYYPKAGESINDSEIYVPKTEVLIDISGTENAPVTNLHFENLDIKYGAWNAVTDRGIMSRQADENLSIDGIPLMIPGQVKVSYADGIAIENCELSCLGSAAIALTDGVHNMGINGNLIRDISGSGIIIGSTKHTSDSTDSKKCKNISVTNNVITRVAQEYMGNVGISAYYEKGVEILNNTIKETPYSGIHVGWGWLSGLNYDFGYYNISNNHVEDVMCVLDDGAHIYTLGPLSDSIISNNYLKTSGADYGGIYNDTGSGELSIFQNVIEDITNAWTLWSEDAEINIYSNYGTSNTLKTASGISEISEGVALYNKEERPQEAENIIAKAGVGDEYSGLLERAELPEGELSIIHNLPQTKIAWNEYAIPVSGRKPAIIDAEYYYDTYHSDGYQNIVNNSGTIYIVYNRGEWVKYRINVLEEGTYNVSTLYSFYSENSSPLMGVKVDTNTVLTGCAIPSLTSWNEWGTCNLGNITLTEGVHEITFIVENGGFHMQNFMLSKIN